MKRAKLYRYLAGMGCVFAVATGQSLAQDAAKPEISTKLDTAYVTKYVWRGLVANPDPALQPSLTFSHPSGVSFNLWASTDTTNVNAEKGSFTEIDYTLNYAWNASKVAMNAGLIDYTFPNTSFSTTSETYVSACFPGLLSPSLSVNYDFNQAKGYYASLGGGYTCAMPWKKGSPTNLNLSGHVSYASSSYNRFYFGGKDKSAFTDLLLGASVPLTVSKSLTVTPSLSYSRVLDGSLRKAVAKPDNVFGALTASVAF